MQQGCICSLAVYDFPNALTVGYDVVSNRPKVAAYRAPGAPIGTYALESCVDELARELAILAAGAAPFTSSLTQRAP